MYVGLGYNSVHLFIRISLVRLLSRVLLNFLQISLTHILFKKVAEVEPASHLKVMSLTCDYHTASAILKKEYLTFKGDQCIQSS